MSNIIQYVIFAARKGVNWYMQLTLNIDETKLQGDSVIIIQITNLKHLIQYFDS